jgi:hypothetical protein
MRRFAVTMILTMIGIVAPSAVYKAHQSDFCISQWRRVSDKEIFLEAMAGVRGFDSYSNPIGQSRGVYLGEDTDIEKLQSLRVNNDGVIEDSAPIIPSDKEISAFKKDYKNEDNKRRQKISKLLDDPAYLKKCCAMMQRGESEYSGPRLRWFNVMSGMAQRIVRIRIDYVIADPASFSPPLKLYQKTFVAWQKTDPNTTLSGRVLGYKTIHHFVDVDVCGHRKVDYN